MAIYLSLLVAIVACASYVAYQKYTNIYTSFVVKPAKSYDYIIVGAGTAGCVLAARLSEDPGTTVLVIEAGDHMGYFTRIPLTATAAQQGPNDWAIKTTSQKYSSFGMWNQTQFIPRGKGLGGSGQINFLLHGFGLPSDFARWNRLGFKGWSYDDLKGYFVKAFGTVRNEFDSEHCAVDGTCPGAQAPMKLKLSSESDELMSTFRHASSLLQADKSTFKRATATASDGRRHSSYDGYLKPALGRKNLHVLLKTQAVSSLRKTSKTRPFVPDVHTCHLCLLQGGALGGDLTFKRATATASYGRRPSSYDRYLEPALGRNNLHDLLKTQVVSIRFENKIASSLYILQNHRQLDNIFANKEIILSAGVFKTPQILMTSGIGPKRVLEKLKVRPVSINEAVGQNLHDHTNMPIYVSIQKPISVTLSKVFSIGTVWQYYWTSSGLLSFPPVAGVEYRSKSSVMLFSMGTASERLLRELSNYIPRVFRDTYPFYNVSSKEGFMWLCSCLQPRSRGHVTVGDTRTVTQPTVNVNYLKDARDAACIIKAIRRAEQLISSQPFRDIGAVMHWPRPERCRTYWNYTLQEQKAIRKRRRFSKDQTPKAASSMVKSPPDEYLSCIIREVAVTGHHAGGTCAGGRVVDDLLRVKSVSGLRIMDASVLPSPVSLFPNSVLIAMAEKTADIIRNTK